MNIIVTGAAGFIGSHVCIALLKQGHTLWGVDNFDPFYPRSIKEINVKRISTHGDWHFVEGDLCSGVLDQLPVRKGNVDVVLHLAGKAGVRPSIESPEAYVSANIQGTLKVLDFARDMQVPKVVFASSSSVYGILPQVPWHEDLKLDKAISPYAVSKLSGESMGYCYHHLYGIQFIALRFFTVYGPNQRPDLAIHKFFKAVYEGRQLPVYGDGSTRRDYTYVSDTVEGVCAAVLKLNAPHEVINLGNNKPVALQELLNAIERVTGKTFQINRLPEQPGDVPVTYADISRAKTILGYEPKVDLMAGLTLFNEWFKASRNENVQDVARQPIF